MNVRRALISVSDKRGVVSFGKGLAALGIEILSTGGTRRVLAEAGVQVRAVSAATGQEEILGGRVKTLHPVIHGGILADRAAPSHVVELRKHGISPIDLVAVNLYPFREVAARPDATDEEVIEAIDIGGPTMVRAAAKNFQGVTAIIDPDDYPRVLAALEQDGEVSADLRLELARKAFRHTQAYDAAISAWFERRETGEPGLPHHLQLELEREIEPRYGENPHQGAAIYRSIGGPGLFHGFEQLQGKKLSYNNMLDAEAARRLVSVFSEPTVVILKHNTPCGVGRGETLTEAYERALACDPMSAFGSVIAVNRPADQALAEAMRGLFVEVVLAPSCDEDGAALFAEKRHLRVLTCPLDTGSSDGLELRSIDGGFLAQTPDKQADQPEEWSCTTQRQPTAAEESAMRFAWKVVRAVKSNAIVITNEQQTVGLGAGQMSRVDACRIAIQKAQLDVGGCVAASDAFFPFADGLQLLADAGVTAIVQPGGSKRDAEVVAAADAAGVAMWMTGRRHFRH